MESKLLGADELKDLGQLKPLKTVTTIVHSWGSILLVIYATVSLNKFWLYPLAMFFIAAKQHALAGMAHEGAHGLVFKNKVLNDWITRLFFAFPIFVSHSRYRAIHMLHHRKLYTDQDPDTPIYNRYPVEPKLWRKFLRRDFMGQTILKNLIYFAPLPKMFYPGRKDPIQSYPHEPDGVSLLLFHLTICGATVFFGVFHYYFLLWLVPYGTILQVLLRIRGALEHGNIKDKNQQLLNTRTTTDNPLVLFFMAPLGLNYHLEHHIYPTLPWYSLARVHDLLLDKHPQAMWSFSYAKAVKELQSS